MELHVPVESALLSQAKGLLIFNLPLYCYVTVWSGYLQPPLLSRTVSMLSGQMPIYTF